MAAEQTGQPYYYVPNPSHWPVTGSLALLLMASGAVGLFNDYRWGKYVLVLGLIVLLIMMFGWFGRVVRESEGNLYNKKVDVSFRWSMSWFIFSEVMFFAAFFGALFWARLYSVPDLASFDSKLLWPDYTGGWPTNGPYLAEKFTPMAAWGIPAINTLLLLSSGVTLTWAHWGLMKNNRFQLKLGLFLTIALGFTFLFLQIHEYGHAYSELNLKLTTGVYGATFFMLTGFHGFHVTVGAIMLTVMLVRSFRGHFTPDHHFAFEAAAWYWHFVDVVWLLLFILVYWLA
jgi:cytochrome c oxidase subunit 3